MIESHLNVQHVKILQAPHSGPVSAAGKEHRGAFTSTAVLQDHWAGTKDHELKLKRWSYIPLHSPPESIFGWNEFLKTMPREWFPLVGVVNW